jgi:hypothetical protein
MATTLEKLKGEMKRKKRFETFIGKAKRNDWKIVKSNSVYDLIMIKNFKDNTELLLKSTPILGGSIIKLELYDKNKFLSTLRPLKIDSFTTADIGFNKSLDLMEDIVKQPKKIHDLTIEKFGIDRAKSKLRKVV